MHNKKTGGIIPAFAAAGNFCATGGKFFPKKILRPKIWNA
jgi:hypothetical protein